MPQAVPDQRKRELAQIHIAKAQLDMAEDTYRDLLFSLARVRSAADLDQIGRTRVLEHFKKFGWKPQAPRQGNASKLAKTPKGRKMLVLWSELYKAGKVVDKRESALLKFIQHETKVDRPEWLTGVLSNQVIEQLKKWLAR